MMDRSTPSAEDETHVEADGSIFKWTPHAEAMMTGDGIEMSRRTDDRIAAITHDGVVDRAASANLASIPPDFPTVRLVARIVGPFFCHCARVC